MHGVVKGRIGVRGLSAHMRASHEIRMRVRVVCSASVESIATRDPTRPAQVGPTISCGLHSLLAILPPAEPPVLPGKCPSA